MLLGHAFGKALPNRAASASARTRASSVLGSRASRYVVTDDAHHRAERVREALRGVVLERDKSGVRCGGCARVLGLEQPGGRSFAGHAVTQAGMSPLLHVCTSNVNQYPRTEVRCGPSPKRITSDEAAIASPLLAQGASIDLVLKADQGNVIEVRGSAQVSGRVRGSGNIVQISSTAEVCAIQLDIHGNNNRVQVVDSRGIKGLTLRVGNHRAADNCSFIAEQGLSVEGNVQALLYQDGNQMKFGEDCMVSNSVIFRGGEHPHLLFEIDSGEYLDNGSGIFIGKHVWIGEGAYITKSVAVASGSIVAARAVVTRRFEEENVVIGGNPAVVIRRGVEWLRNRSNLVRGTPYENSYRTLKASRAGVSSDEDIFWEWSRTR